MTRLCAVVVLLLSPLALTAQEGSDPGMDSYFGGTDFIGQEVVYFEGTPC